MYRNVQSKVTLEVKFFIFQFFHITSTKCCSKLIKCWESLFKLLISWRAKLRMLHYQYLLFYAAYEEPINVEELKHLIALSEVTKDTTEKHLKQDWNFLICFNIVLKYFQTYIFSLVSNIYIFLWTSTCWYPKLYINDNYNNNNQTNDIHILNIQVLWYKNQNKLVILNTFSFQNLDLITKLERICLNWKNKFTYISTYNT